MDFGSDDVKSHLVILLLLIYGTAMVQAIHASEVKSSDVQPVASRGGKGRCLLKDMVTVFVEIEGSGCNRSRNYRADDLYHYLIIVQNRCKYCNAKSVGVEVSGYFLGNEIMNLMRPFAPGGDQYVVKYTNSKQVGGVSPARATFYECRDI